ncbi:MAG TPA: hypothetical protein VL225_01840 [Vicinamibacterales bacterium]|jgi:hypothetical protein|nr:hypothetical protein [Vicinamibacterales bacterium]
MASPRRPVRAFLVTLLDAALIALTAAVIVVFLGGRTRIDVAGLRVSLRAAGNLFALAAAFGIVRLAAGGRMRLFPLVAPASRGRIDAERQRLAQAPTVSRGVWVCAGLTLAGSIVWIAPHIWHPRSVPDLGDPLFSAWRIARIAHQLATDPRHLFDGNIFYPLPLTLTYSDSTFLEALLGTPFLLAGTDPLLVANGLTLAAFPLCGVAFFYAAWRLTDDPRAALVAGLLGAWYPFHAEHYSHLELHWVMFVPVALILGLRLLADPSARRGLLFGLAVAGQWLASMYMGVMLMTFLAPFLVMVAVAWRVRPTRALAMGVLAAAAVLAPALTGLGYPYMKSRDARGERGRQEVSDGSALPSDYGATHIRMTTYMRHTRVGNRGERELFPGTSTLLLGAVGVVPPLTGAGIATIVAGALTFDWSLGFKGLTYDDLYRRSIVHRGMRVPARFSAIVGAALVLLGAYGARRLIRLGRSMAAQAAICGALAAIVLVDLRIDPRIHPYSASIPSIYARVEPSMILVELPRFHDTEYMYFSTRHWAHLLGGYSGYLPLNADLQHGLETFPSPEGIASLKRAGATHLTYNCALEIRRGRCDAVLAQLADNPLLEPVASERWDNAPVTLYKFRE